MRYFLLFLCMYLSNALCMGMEALLVNDVYRKDIARSIRQQENLQDKKFNIRRIEKDSGVAYFCGLIKDKDDNFQQTASGNYHVYDRIMLDAGQNGWMSVVRFDREVSTLEDVHCHYGKETTLVSAELQKLIQAQGRKELCQDVNLKDPMRREILGVLRARYLGDSNTLTLNGTRPTVKFVVKEMCATETMPGFVEKPTGILAALMNMKLVSWSFFSKRELRVAGKLYLKILLYFSRERPPSVIPVMKWYQRMHSLTS